ncbi:hypothetical protein, partial [Niallia circulans]|uniref:hypothetical protein n=1 Tax=Niallia circulans TaxID=1397 RepID=UPI0026F19F85
KSAKLEKYQPKGGGNQPNWRVYQPKGGGNQPNWRNISQREEEISQTRKISAKASKIRCQITNQPTKPKKVVFI